jgi:hypothetical protein
MPTNYAVSADETAARVLDGEAVIIDFTTGFYFGLNPTATALWLRLQEGPRSADGLSAALAAAYGADPGDVATDVRFFLEGMAAEGLVATTGEAEIPVAADDLEAHGPYLAPLAERYEKLDELMLSGE